MDIQKESESKIVETDVLKVKGNLISWDNSIIQISNICMLTTTDVEANKFPMYSLLFVLVGLFIAKTNIMAGLASLIIGIAWIYFWHKSSKQAKNSKNLNIVLNSGHIFIFIFHDKKFLEKVISVLSDILIASEKKAEYIFNIKNSTFNDHSSLVKNMDVE
ncbi:hypothetical protein [uncultured Phascolarctobacterium sp.]|uniref:hypothetical protein n=1 Tax=uncultured Phascolarctobacterium sp. TaxID=512296 RepID=UPI002598D9E7|nr:hypothetical protein [uncultured Phascolarctobacterium sp.]